MILSFVLSLDALGFFVCVCMFVSTCMGIPHRVEIFHGILGKLY